MRLSVVLSIIAVWGFALVNDSGLGKLFYTEEKWIGWLWFVQYIYGGLGSVLLFLKWELTLCCVFFYSLYLFHISLVMGGMVQHI